MLGRLIDMRHSIDQGVSCGRKALRAAQHDTQLGGMIEVFALIAVEIRLGLVRIRALSLLIILCGTYLYRQWLTVSTTEGPTRAPEQMCPLPK